MCLEAVRILLTLIVFCLHPLCRQLLKEKKGGEKEERQHLKIAMTGQSQVMCDPNQFFVMFEMFKSIHW